MDDLIEFDGPEDRCFGCGQNNERGLRLRFRPTAPGHVESEYVAPEDLRGPPGVIHGGVQAALLDEVLGVAAHTHEQDGRGGSWNVVTAEFQLHYKRPVPTGKPIRIRGRVVRVEERNYFIEGEIVDGNDEILTTAEARWVRVDG